MSILTEAEALINGERQQEYGPPAEHLRRVAQQWSLYIHQKYGIEISLISEDVCWMMGDFKKVRRMHSPKRDSIVDTAGYIGLIEKLQ